MIGGLTVLTLTMCTSYLCNRWDTRSAHLDDKHSVPLTGGTRDPRLRWMWHSNVTQQQSCSRQFHQPAKLNGALRWRKNRKPSVFHCANSSSNRTGDTAFWSMTLRELTKKLRIDSSKQEESSSTDMVRKTSSENYTEKSVGIEDITVNSMASIQLWATCVSEALHG